MVLEGRVGGMAGIDAGNGLTNIAGGTVDVVALVEGEGREAGQVMIPKLA